MWARLGVPETQIRALRRLARGIFIAYDIMTTMLNPSEHPHRRWNPLLRSYVICSPHRTQRPWQGAQERVSGNDLPAYDSSCYLCPGNTRATGATNEAYTSTFIFENDFAALKDIEVESQGSQNSTDVVEADLFRMEPSRGKCYVLCFHPNHNLTLAHLTTLPYSAEEHILPIVRAWSDMYLRIPKENPFVKYIQFFENKGSAMGCSNPHPHGQIWALDHIPCEPLTELESMRAFALDTKHSNAQGPRDPWGRPSLLLEYVHLELKKEGRPRIVCMNNDFVALVPFWAVWPFEIMVLPYKRFIASVAVLNESEALNLAHILGEVACRFDNLFQTSFPYSMGLHQRPIPAKSEPTGEDLSDFAVLHIHFYPPLLRSATVRKFLVGYVFF